MHFRCFRSNWVFLRTPWSDKIISVFCNAPELHRIILTKNYQSSVLAWLQMQLPHKVLIFSGHKISRNLQCRFVLRSDSQNFVAFSEYMNFIMQLQYLAWDISLYFLEFNFIVLNWFEFYRFQYFSRLKENYQNCFPTLSSSTLIKLL